MGVYWNAFLDLFYPRFCALCGEGIDSSQNGFMCSFCFQRLLHSVIPSPQCHLCGAGLVAAVDDISAHQRHVCGYCITRTYFFDAGISCFFYEDIVRAGLLAIKFGKDRYLASQWGTLMAYDQRLFSIIGHIDYIIPIPLHYKRQKERGFNQAQICAQRIAYYTKVPILTDVLVRARATMAQSALTESERTKNIKNAFCVLRPHTVKGQRLMLVDDLFTTGATLNEASRVLKEQGAAAITVYTFARPAFPSLFG